MPVPTATIPPTAPTLVKPSRLLIAGVAAWVLVVAAVGYVFTGSPVGLGVAAAPAPPEAEQPGMAQLAAMVDKLALRLKEQPDDAVGWAMLARSYNVLGRNAEALPAYAKAVQMRGDDANLLADYAGAMAMENQRKIGGQPLALVQRALALDPNNVKALSLLGMEAFERKDYAAAVLPWEKILALAPTDADLVQQVTASVAEARALGGLPATTATAAAPQSLAPPAAAASGAMSAAVSGVVSLSASLAAQAAPSDTVFVFARAVEGPRMPLAVLRKQVKDLPFEFKLDDSLAMAPDARLSMHARVVVSARISKSGNAIAQPGDLVGQSATVALGSSGLKIEIAQTVPR